MKDFFNYPIYKGCFLLYYTRSGSSLWENIMLVTNIDEENKRIKGFKISYYFTKEIDFSKEYYIYNYERAIIIDKKDLERKIEYLPLIEKRKEKFGY